jgi:uncharacterized protein YukJ
MPLKKYGVLAGRPIDRRLGTGANPHYQIHMVDNTTDYRIAVNVQSSDKSSVEYLVRDHFEHSLLTKLAELPLGWHDLPSKPDSGAIDFIRANIGDPAEFVPLPFNIAGPDNDLNEKFDAQIQRAMGDQDAVLYAFGERWGPEKNIKDKIFGFLPGNGVHDIHMNQGNSQRFRPDDGVWQDGGLLLHYPAQDQWVAIFLAFQSQAWHTDDQTGHTVPDLPGPGPAPVPGPGEPDHMVRIIAALVNPPGPAPEAETVTLLNASPQPVDLTGWSILDRAKHRMTIQGRLLPPGDSIRIQVAAPVQLGNHGGLITLLNPDGLKVDGVAYTQAQADAEGWSIIF